MSRRVTIVRSGLPLPSVETDELVVSFDEFRGWLRRGKVLAHIARHARGRLLVHRLESAGRPLPLGLALRLMTRGQVTIEDVCGRRRTVTARLLARWAAAFASEPFRVRTLLRRVQRSVDELERGGKKKRPISVDLAASPLYLRTDLSFGVRAGGSVGHIAGVVNELGTFTGPPVLLTTDDIPTIRAGVEVLQVAPGEAFWNFKELPTFLLNDVFDRAAADRVVALRGGLPAFVYQRYSLNNYAGLRISRRYDVPFVLEYNGSEIWMGRHWGRPLRYEALARRIERLNLSAADLIVVVSRAMADEVVSGGVDPASVLVNPNGVDPDRYRPDIDGGAVRDRYGLRDLLVVGFIGTFGPWHGAEILARAFVRLLHDDPARARAIRLLMIGDGARGGEVRRILEEGGSTGSAVFTGLVPQEQGPEFLGACDVLCAPHVRNPDGSVFFGSPTKLFEYMAMGRGIVASDLGQIGEVVDHGRSGLLVEPGDVEALAGGLRRLLDDAGLRTALGTEARRVVVERYTWREHTRRTIERLVDVVARNSKLKTQNS